MNKIKLNSEFNQTLLVPRVVYTLFDIEENTEVIYLTDNYYSPESEISISPFSDKVVNEFKPYVTQVASEKDKNAMDFSKFFETL